MKSHIEIIGNSTPGSGPSVLVQFHSQKYMFNCGEGTQRLCIENKVKLSKLQNIFLTRVDWDCVGGLPGMLLTLADQGIENIKLLGGKNLTHFMAATRHFVYRTSTTVETHEFDLDGAVFNDENLTVHPIILFPHGYSPLAPMDLDPAVRTGTKRDHKSMDDGDSRLNLLSPTAQMSYKRQLLSDMFSNQAADSVKLDEIDRNKEGTQRASGHPLAPIEEDTRKGGDGKITKLADKGEGEAESTIDRRQGEQASEGQQQQRNEKKVGRHIPEKLPRSQPVPQVISYVCQGPGYPGKFDPKTATALGLKPGKEYGILQKGISVTLPDGTVIHPHQVLGQPRPGSIFIIVDCPTPAYIPSLLASPVFAQYQIGDRGKQPRCVVHVLGKGVIEDKEYREWMRKFGEETQHIVGNEDYCAQISLFNDHSTIQLKLSQLDERIFPIPRYNNTPAKFLESVPDLPTNTVPLSNLLQFHLEPVSKLDRSKQLPLFDHLDEESEAVKSLAAMAEYQMIAKEVKEEIVKFEMEGGRKARPGDDVVVTTLGTGSAIPSKYRNVSATLLEIPGHGNILLDAGEGTYNQILRLKGVDGLEACLRNLKLMFVSHLHADHHLGVVNVLNKWNELHRDLPDILYVVAPCRFETWLQEYSDVEDFGMSRVKFVDNEDVLFSKENNWKTNKSLTPLKNSLGLSALKTVDVIHCRWAYGVSFEHSSGWKIVYSGDTRPSNKLVDVGQDATVLIHEATLDDDMMAVALEKRHSTTREAVEIGIRMRAASTLLTHFSQRYPKVPIFTDANASVGVAFDLMQVRVGELGKLPRFVKALKVLYNDEDKEANKSGNSVEKTEE